MNTAELRTAFFERGQIPVLLMGVAALALLSQFYLLISPYYILLGLLGFLLASTVLRLPVLTTFGICHLGLMLVGGTLQSLWHNILDMSILLLAYVAMAIGTVKLFLALPQKIRILVWLFLAVFLAFFGLGPDGFLSFRMRFLLSLSVWPMALLLGASDEETKKVPWWGPVMSFVPAWHIQFFHNIPTEPGPASFFSSQPSRDQILESQKEGVRLLGWTLGFVIFKAVFDWLVWGRPPLGITFLKFEPVWAPWAVIKWSEIVAPTEPLWKKVATVYACFSSSLLHFIVVGTLVNALARIWGFRFPLNVKFDMGLRVVTQWNTFFYYLNNVVEKVFYQPLLGFFSFVRDRRWRASLALVSSVYLFGYAYLVFLFQEDLFAGQRWKFLVEYRGYYLGLVCLLGLIRIWGPKTKRKAWSYKLAPYFYFMVMAPLLMFGVLSLDPNFFQF